MTQPQFDQRLRQAIDRTAPDDVEAVLSRCETRKGTVIPMTKKKSGKWLRSLAAACLALVLAGGGGGLYFYQANAVASVVSLDVNPSIELKANRSEKVISCQPLNEEAELVLSGMDGGADLKGTKLDVAVNAVVGALLKNGYLDSISSAILISVEARDSDRAARLQQELTAAVDGALQYQSANAAILSLVLTQDAEIETMARENNLSTGKAYLVRQVMEMNGTIATNSTTALDQLSALSVEELNDLLETGEKRIPIGKPTAQLAAEEYAGTLAVDSVTAETDPELDEPVPHYEVTLHHPTLGEFEYTVDAFTGKVLSGTPDILDNNPSVAGQISEKRAKEIAFSHAGIKETDTAAIFVSLEREDNALRCEVEFYAGGFEYSYEIDGVTGAVLDWEKEPDSKSVIGGADGPTAVITTSYISRAKAVQAALDHAGAQEAQISGLQAELDKEDGHAVYKVEFRWDDTEYEYEIDALDGAVWKYESESIQTAAPAFGDIGEDAAKAAALNHAGVTASQATELEVERDWDDGRLEYEVEFKSGGMEYKYTIDGAAGTVLEHEMDWDD